MNSATVSLPGEVQFGEEIKTRLTKRSSCGGEPGHGLSKSSQVANDGRYQFPSPSSPDSDGKLSTPPKLPLLPFFLNQDIFSFTMIFQKKNVPQLVINCASARISWVRLLTTLLHLPSFRSQRRELQTRLKEPTHSVASLNNLHYSLVKLYNQLQVV